MMHAREDIGAIFLNFLAPAASVAELAAMQFVIDDRDVDGQTGGQAGDKRQQRLSVRFTRSVKTQHFRKPSVSRKNLDAKQKV
jgi:hypothetical protein